MKRAIVSGVQVQDSHCANKSCLLVSNTLILQLHNYKGLSALTASAWLPVLGFVQNDPCIIFFNSLGSLICLMFSLHGCIYGISFSLLHIVVLAITDNSILKLQLASRSGLTIALLLVVLGTWRSVQENISIHVHFPFLATVLHERASFF